ncbi:hypothetical protein ACFQ10_40385 [Streptomyces indonesiensis]
MQRAFTQLEGRAHGPGALARAADLDDSTVYRILQSGVHQGIFVREGRGLYRLGSAAPQLGLKALAHSPAPEAAHALLKALRRATGGWPSSICWRPSAARTGSASTWPSATPI